MSRNRFQSRPIAPQRLWMPVVVGVALLVTMLTTLTFAWEEASAAVLPAAPAAVDATAATVYTGTQWVPPTPAYRVQVVQDGVHVLTYAALQTAGLPVTTIDPHTFRLYWMGQEVAIQVSGEGDGQFNPGDELTFYGRSIDSLYYEGHWPDHKYTGTNTYWLTYGSGNGKRMTSKDGSVAGTAAGPYLYKERQEQQNRYDSYYPRYAGNHFDPKDDHWFWQMVQIFGYNIPRSLNFTFNGSAVATGNVNGAIGVRAVSKFDIGHGIRIKLNGTQIYENTTGWIDMQPFEAMAQAPQNLFKEGSNTLVVELFNIDEGLGALPISEKYIDWLKISYFRNHVAINDRLTFDGEAAGGPWRYTVTGFSAGDLRIYDVTDLHNPQQVGNGAVTGGGPYEVAFGDGATGRRYAVTTATARLAPAAIQLVTRPSSPNALANLLDTANEADWIAITHSDFWTNTQPLATHRSGLYRVAMVDVQQIYDQFNGGMLSSESIREFLRYAYHNWAGKKPKYVLLVGGGTNDMRHYLNDSKPTYVPTFLYPADPTLGETAADNRFVMLVNNDILPDMNIGRMPAYSKDEVKIMVDKTISYETTPAVNDWNTNVLLISDDLDDGGGNFYHFSDVLADEYMDQQKTIKFLPDPYTYTKAYLSRTCDLDNEKQLDKLAVECRRLITETINDKGALLVSYVGHAKKDSWAREQLMDSTLVNTLKNSDKLSIFLAMACFEGFFHDAGSGFRSLGERYMIYPNGGAVASWSPTGFGVATGHDYLEQGLFIALFTDKVPTLGDAMTFGKEYLHQHKPDIYEDLIDTFTLFGDPALSVKLATGPTAVDMAGMEAHVQAEGVTVQWSTASEVEIAGFNLLRSESETGPFVRINPEPIWANNPGSSSGNHYTYLDRAAGTRAWYRLEVLKLNGSVSTYGLVSPSPALPPTLYLPSLHR